MRPLKLKLLNLAEGNFDKGVFGALRQPPLCHAFLAAMVPKDLDIDVEIIDEQIEPIDFDMDCDAVAFSLTTHIAKKCYDYALEFKKRNKTVIMGGYHATLCPDEANGYADSILIGEAEEVWPQLLRDLADGKLKKRYVQEGPVDLGKTPIPRRDLLKLGKYLIPNTVIVTRGCPYMCSYCVSSKIYGGFRRRDHDAVIEEINSLSFKDWKESVVMFVDDELFFPKKEALEFFRKLEKLNITWVSQASMPALLDKELMGAAARAGCAIFTVGIESLDIKTRKGIRKCTYSQERLERAVEYANDLGMQVGAMFILGLDTDTKETIEETVKLLRKSRFLLINFGVLRAYPTTPIYANLLRENRIRKDWWLGHSAYEDAFNENVPDYLKVYYQPKHFTPGELQIKALECERDLNSPFSFDRLRTWLRCLIKGKKFHTMWAIAGAIAVSLNAAMMLRKIKKLRKRQAQHADRVS